MHDNSTPAPLIASACFYCGGIGCNAFNDQGKPCHQRCHDMGPHLRRAIKRGKLKMKPRPGAGSKNSKA